MRKLMSWIEDNKVVAVAFAIWIAFFLGIVCSRVYAYESDLLDAAPQVKYIGSYKETIKFSRPSDAREVPITQQVVNEVYKVVRKQGLRITGTTNVYQIVWSHYMNTSTVFVLVWDNDDNAETLNMEMWESSERGWELP